MEITSGELELIMHTQVFRGVSESIVKKLISNGNGELKAYTSGSIVYSPSSFSRSLGIVLSGSLRVTKENADGHSIVMSTLGKGSVFGAAALFNNETEYVTKITAAENSRVILFPQRLVERLLQQEPSFAFNYVKYLSERILFLNRKIYFLTAGTAEQKLANFILENFTEGEAKKLPMTMESLASALNISRASLYRALDVLTDNGIIVKDGKSLCMIDSKKLKEIIKME